MAFFIGIGIGGTIAGDGTVFVEYCPENNRRVLVIMSVLCSVSASFAAIMALVYAAIGIEFVWRYLLGTIAVFTLIVSFLRLSVMETP